MLGKLRWFEPAFNRADVGYIFWFGGGVIFEGFDCLMALAAGSRPCLLKKGTRAWGRGGFVGKIAALSSGPNFPQ